MKGRNHCGRVPAGREAKAVRVLGWVLLAVYLLLVVKVVLLKYYSPQEFLSSLLGNGAGFRSVNLIPFRSISSYLASGMDGWRKVGNVLGNLGVFVPLGVLLPALFGRQLRRPLLVTLALGLGLSVLLEVLQWWGRVGVSDIDDVILNVVGVGLGIGVYLALRRLLKTRPRAVLSATIAVVVVLGAGASVVAVSSFGLDLGLSTHEIHGKEDEPRPSVSLPPDEHVEPTAERDAERVLETRPDLIGEVTTVDQSHVTLIEHEILLWENDTMGVGRAPKDSDQPPRTIELMPDAQVFKIVGTGAAASLRDSSLAEIPIGAQVQVWGEGSGTEFVGEVLLFLV